jgi:hypothetical protein
VDCNEERYLQCCQQGDDCDDIVCKSCSEDFVVCSACEKPICDSCKDSIGACSLCAIMVDDYAFCTACLPQFITYHCVTEDCKCTITIPIGTSCDHSKDEEKINYTKTNYKKTGDTIVFDDLVETNVAGGAACGHDTFSKVLLHPCLLHLSTLTLLSGRCAQDSARCHTQTQDPFSRRRDR